MLLHRAGSGKLAELQVHDRSSKIGSDVTAFHSANGLKEFKMDAACPCTASSATQRNPRTSKSIIEQHRCELALDGIPLLGIAAAAHWCACSSDFVSSLG